MTATRIRSERLDGLRWRPLRTGILVLLAVLLGVVVGVTVLVWWAQARGPMSSRISPECAAIGDRPVGDLEVIHWDNGMTISSANWLVVLTDGVTHATATDRAGIAAALRADREGYHDFLAALSEDVRAAAKRLHALALEPEGAARRAQDPDVLADALLLIRFANRECGYV